MKKILLATAAIAALTSSAAFAESNKEFYLNANVGWAKFDNIKLTNNNIDLDQKLKSKSNVSFGVAAGYYVMENVRAELAYDHFVNPTFKKTIEGGGLALNIKQKMKVDTILLNGYVDVFDAGPVKFFVGAGLGYSRISSKLDVDISAGGVDLLVGSVKAKASNNFAYALYAGASTEVSEGIHAELKYSYKDLGKAKKFADDNGNELSDSKAKIKGHNVTVGVRFDI